LVGAAAEVLGAKAGKEVSGDCWQEWSQLYLEPVGNEADICQLCGAEVVDDHLSNGIKNMGLRLMVTEVL